MPGFVLAQHRIIWCCHIQYRFIWMCFFFKQIMVIPLCHNPFSWLHLIICNKPFDTVYYIRKINALCQIHLQHSASITSKMPMRVNKRRHQCFSLQIHLFRIWRQSFQLVFTSYFADFAILHQHSIDIKCRLVHG